LPVFGFDERSPTGGDYPAGPAAKVLYDLSFQPAEGLFALIPENIRDGLPRPPFNLLVGIHRGPTQAFRENSAHEGLPGGHESDQRYVTPSFP
jgi:hypothetical protein